MAKVEFTIQGPHGAVTLRAFLTAFSNQLSILNDIDAVLSGKPKGLLDWYVTDLRMGSAHGAIQSGYRDDEEEEIVPPNHDRKVVQVYRNGLRRIEGEGNSPAYYLDRDLIAARQTFRLIGREGVSGYTVGIDDAEPDLDITARASVNVEQLIKPGERTIGGVEGRLVAISIAGRSPRFTVIDAVTHKTVACQFSDDYMEEVKMALGKRVFAHGDLIYNRMGEPKKVVLNAFRILEDKSTLPTSDDLIREIAGASDMSTREYLDLVRGS
jgi:hypothetical protein